MARFVVTGGAGFIGSHLVDALISRGHAVRVVDDLSTGRRENLHPRAEMTLGDVADPDLMRAAMQGAAGCFHLAAVASVARCNEDWIGTHRTNLGGTISVMDAARRQGNAPVVYASSAAVYGRQHELPITESHLARPLSAYGADKLGCELHARAAFEVHGLPTAGFRFFNVYGPRQDPSSPYSGVISVFAKRIADRQRITIDGDGEQTRDFIYVGDIVRFLLAGMMEARRSHGDAGAGALVLNACTGQATSVRDLARRLADVLGAPADIVHGPGRAGDIRESLGDPGRAARVLGIRAETSLAEGLARTFGPAAGNRPA